MSIPRPEDVPGYSKGCRDMTKFEEAARALRVSPFYHGPDCVPFSRLRPTQVPDPAEATRRSTTSIWSTGKEGPARPRRFPRVHHWLGDRIIA